MKRIIIFCLLFVCLIMGCEDDKDKQNPPPKLVDEEIPRDPFEIQREAEKKRLANWKYEEAPKPPPVLPEIHQIENDPSYLLEQNSTQTSPTKNRPKYLVLTGPEYYEKNHYIQIANITDKMHPTLIETQMIESDAAPNKNFVSVVGIVDNILCLQTTFNKNHGCLVPEIFYSLKLYDLSNFDIHKPLFEKTYNDMSGTAFYTIGNKIFIGTQNEVRLATIKNNEIDVKSVYRFSETEKYKTIDVFVRYKNYLLAIDDVYQPYYGFLFDIKNIDEPKFISKLDLPSGTNIHYCDAVSDGETIYALSSAGYMYGKDNEIYALKYEKENFFVKYYYYGTVATGRTEPQEHKGYFYPTLRELHLLGNRLLSVGMDGIIEMNTNPKLLHPDLDILTSIKDFETRSHRNYQDVKIQQAVEKVKLHLSDGVIRSIAVVDDIVYALHIVYDKKHEWRNSIFFEMNAEKAELLVLKYDDSKDSFVRINSVEVDKRVNRIFLNK